ncbi:MAG: hypothetical protein FJ399_11895 [Verrucomicrobia bacterium]|nr:hypothetical protein [Verrucomicrobiota bacterium]
MLYRGTLYCSVEIGWAAPSLAWAGGSPEVSFESFLPSDSSLYGNPRFWAELLRQTTRRLRSAIRHPAAYNQRVARLLPLGSRTGRILRRLSWPPGTRAPLSRRALDRLDQALARGGQIASLRHLNADRYLRTAAVAYDAAYAELRRLNPREKYRRKADGRHGGLLDLDPRDAAAFAAWFDSRSWSGTHPWEIVFGHPHGVWLFPRHEDKRWRFLVAVDAPGLFLKATMMATALGETGHPITLDRRDEIVAALRGDDRIEIGPFRGQLSLAELREQRSGATSSIEWNPVPIMRLLERPLALPSPER